MYKCGISGKEIEGEFYIQYILPSNFERYDKYFNMEESILKVNDTSGYNEQYECILSTIKGYMVDKEDGVIELEKGKVYEALSKNLRVDIQKLLTDVSDDYTSDLYEGLRIREGIYKEELTSRVIKDMVESIGFIYDTKKSYYKRNLKELRGTKRYIVGSLGYQDRIEGEEVLKIIEDGTKLSIEYGVLEEGYRQINYSRMITNRVKKYPVDLEGDKVLKVTKVDYEKGREKEFINEFAKVTGIILGIDYEGQKLVWVLRNISYLFIDKGVYEDKVIQGEKHFDKWNKGLYKEFEEELDSYIKDYKELVKGNKNGEIYKTVLTMRLGGLIQSYVNDITSYYITKIDQEEEYDIDSVKEELLNIYKVCVVYIQDKKHISPSK